MRLQKTTTGSKLIIKADKNGTVLVASDARQLNHGTDSEAIKRQIERNRLAHTKLKNHTCQDTFIGLNFLIKT